MNRLVNLIILLIFSIFSPFLFFIIFILSPFFYIRLTPILTNRYGSLSLNPEIYLLEKKNESQNKKATFDIFFSSKYGICNKILYELWKKKFLLFPFIWLGLYIF